MKFHIDQQFKERLVGMLVLLFTGVIVIPWILDGEPVRSDDATDSLSLPNPEGLKTHEFDLQNGSIRSVTLAPPERTATPSSPSDDKSDKSTDTQTTQSGLQLSTSMQVKPEPEVPVQANTESPENADSNRPAVQNQGAVTDPVSAWVVQIGSFGDRKNAETQILQLKRKDFPAFLSRFQTDAGKVLYRVRVGPEEDRARADKLQQRLAKSGFKGKVLTHP